ncbi:MAG: hypothetical protein RLZZ383_803, partial [Pseudomonadota bacterium]
RPKHRTIANKDPTVSDLSKQRVSVPEAR